MCIRRVLRRATAATLFLALTAAIAGPSPQYEVVELPTLQGGNANYTMGVNSLGTVVGSMYFQVGQSNVPRAVTWKNGAVVELMPGSPYSSSAWAINANDEIVGHSRDVGNNAFAMWWRDGQTNYLPAPSGFTNALAYGINDGGTVVGYAWLGTISAATIWENGTVSVLPFLPGSTSAVPNAISNAGHIVGDSRIGSAVYATMWVNGVASNLGVLPGSIASFAKGVNDLGHAVGGSYDASNNYYPTLWIDGQAQALNMLPVVGFYQSYAYSINAYDQIVGTTLGNFGSGSNRYHATLWQDGAVYDLNKFLKPRLRPYIELTVATSINDKGQISVYGYDSRQPNPNQRAFLLIPRNSPGNGKK